MRSISTLTKATPLILATLLALGMACVWTAIMFPTIVFITPWLPNNIEDQLWLVVAALLSPLMASLALFVYIPLRGVGLPSEIMTSPYVVLSLALLLTVLIFLTVRTYKRHFRFSETGALTWAIFVFLWGVPGYIGYLAHRRWPVMERCSSCGAETPRDRDDCLHCHTPFPPPARVGTEIFA